LFRTVSRARDATGRSSGNARGNDGTTDRREGRREGFAESASEVGRSVRWVSTRLRAARLNGSVVWMENIMGAVFDAFDGQSRRRATAWGAMDEVKK